MRNTNAAARAFFTLIVVGCVTVGCSRSTAPSTPSAPTPFAATSRSAVQTPSGTDPLPSWSDGPAKRAIVNFVKITTDKANAQFVPPEDRIATFDQDGTTWVEHPMYSQLRFMLDRVASLAPQHPEWSSKPLFKGLLVGDAEAMAKYTQSDLDAIDKGTRFDMPIDEFRVLVKNWMDAAKHPRFDKLYSQLVYQPMLEVMKYLRDNGYRTYIVTGGGQEFVRVYAQQVYGVPPEQVIGSAVDTRYEINREGKSILTRRAKLLLDNNNQGKAEDIYLFVGRRPHAAFGNSTGDQQMLEYTQGVGGASLEMLVLHDDSLREYAYGPAQDLPDTHFGKFTQALYDEARARGWTVISMKNDWKRIFAWEK